MGLLNGWFALTPKTDEEPIADWRREPRRRVATAWPPYEARIDKERAQVLDYSDKGFCLAIDENRAPPQAMVELLHGDETLRHGYALLVWRRGARVGYSFARGLTVEKVQEQRVAQAAAREAALLPVKVAAREALREAETPSPPIETPEPAEAGAEAAASETARLRNRLKL